jgi:hypothetical protein
MYFSYKETHIENSNITNHMTKGNKIKNNLLTVVSLKTLAKSD